MSKLRAHLMAALVLVLAPLAVLGPCLLGERTYVPYDLSMFSPRATTLDAEELQDTRRQANLDPTEIPVMFVPQLRFLRGHVVEGRLPHWDPYSRSGTTLWASSVLGAAYPLNWLVLFYGDPQDGLALTAWLGFFIAGLLMYGFLLQIGLRPLAALFGALIFALSGTLAANAHFYQRMHSLIWLPGMLWALLRIGRNQGTHRIPGMISLSLCILLSLTAGFPPYAIVVCMIAAVYGLWLSLLTWHRDGIAPAFRLALILGIAAVLGVGAASIQTLPALEFFPHSNRTPGTGASLFQVFDLYGLLGYVSPDLISHPHLQADAELPYAKTPIGWLLQNRRGADGNHFLALNYNFVEYTVFVGTLTLFLAISGLLSKGPRFRIFATGALMLLLLLACGGVYIEGVLALPPFSWVPPMRFLGPACMMLAALAAMGLDNIEGLRQRLVTVIAILAICLAGLALAFWIWATQQTAGSFRDGLVPALLAKYQPLGVTLEDVEGQLDDSVLGNALQQMTRGLGRTTLMLALSGVFFLLLPTLRRRSLFALRAIAILVTVAELLLLAIPINQGRLLTISPDTPVHAFLRTQRDKYRDQGGFSVIRAFKPTPTTRAASPHQLPGGTLLTERIRDIHAYTFVDGRSHKPFAALYGPEQLASGFWPMAFPDDERLSRPYFDLIGARFVLSEDALEHAGKRVGPVWRAPDTQAFKFRGGEFFVYERPNPMPRAFVVHRHIDVGSNEEAIARRLVREDFSPRQEVLLDSETVEAMRTANALLGPETDPQSRTVRVVPQDSPDALELQVSPGKPGYLVTNDTFLPGWKALVDGKETPIYRANLFQRLVPIGADGTTVRFVYTLPGFWTGLVLTIVCLALLALLALAVATSRTTRTATEQAL